MKNYYQHCICENKIPLKKTDNPFYVINST